MTKRNDISNKIKIIKYNFKRSRNISRGIDEENRFLICKETIEHEHLDQVITELLNDTNENIQRHSIQTVEFIVSRDPRFASTWMDRIVKMYDATKDTSVSIINGEIIHYFKDTGEASFDALALLLTESDTFKIRYNSLFLFGEIRVYNPEISKLLMNYLENDNDERIRSVSALTLGKIKDDDAIDSLTRAIQKDKSVNVRCASAFALGEIKSEKTLPILIKVLNDKSELVRTEVVVNIGKFKSNAKKAVQNLVNILNSETETELVKIKIIEVLGEIGACEAIPAISLKIRSNKSPTILVECIKLIGELYYSNCEDAISLLPELNALTEDTNVSESIRLISSKILQKICFEEYELELSECKKRIKPEIFDSQKGERIFQAQIQSIKEFYEKYHKELEKIWDKYPYDTSIFIMMPFRFDEDTRYVEIRNAIKNASEKQGFKAYLSNDKGRKFTDVLWENLLLNMLSCKYGIAILPSEEIMDAMKKKIWVINNPNVALEYGFMYAHGRDNVLILSNDRKKLPVDIQGLITDEFNLNKPYENIYKIITEWLNEKE